MLSDSSIADLSDEVGDGGDEDGKDNVDQFHDANKDDAHEGGDEYATGGHSAGTDGGGPIFIVVRGFSTDSDENRHCGIGPNTTTFLSIMVQTWHAWLSTEALDGS